MMKDGMREWIPAAWKALSKRDKFIITWLLGVLSGILFMNVVAVYVFYLRATP